MMMMIMMMMIMMMVVMMMNTNGNNKHSNILLLQLAVMVGQTVTMMTADTAMMLFRGTGCAVPRCPFQCN